MYVNIYGYEWIQTYLFTTKPLKINVKKKRDCSLKNIVSILNASLKISILSI